MGNFHRYLQLHAAEPIVEHDQQWRFAVTGSDTYGHQDSDRDQDSDTVTGNYTDQNPDPDSDSDSDRDQDPDAEWR